MESFSECNDKFCTCLVCPHQCRIAPGSSGICGVRHNTGNGMVEPATYGVVSGYGSDPIEKKPLYHFHPGTSILSVGSYGCNLRCDFCQNHSISSTSGNPTGPVMSPRKIVDDALQILNNTGIAFTYNEPVVWIEFMVKVAETARASGLNTVMVSNGYVNREPLHHLLQFIDAFNIDLKFFSDENYKKFTGGTLAPVLRSIGQIAEAGRHLEITTLVIPGLNDTEEEMDSISAWIAERCGKDTPLHISRYHPAHKRTTPATPISKLAALHRVASGNLSFVYVGNAPGLRLSDTICPDCGTKVTERDGYYSELKNLTPEGKCSNCGKIIYSRFTYPS